MAKILIVDDQKSVLLTLESILTEHKHFVVSATSAFDALDHLARQSFDLLITDAVMPGGKSGFELTRIVRASKELQTIPIILLTGKREKSDVQRGISLGVDEYIVKPLDPDILMSKIESLLSQATKTTTFMNCPVRIPAQIQDVSEVISISEMGLTLLSNVAVTVGSKIRIETVLFEEVGIKNPVLRVTKCSLPNSETQMHTIEVHFFGLTEKEFQPIRLFINSRRIKSA